MRSERMRKKTSETTKRTRKTSTKSKTSKNTRNNTTKPRKSRSKIKKVEPKVEKPSLHEHWREYTQEEINQIKRDVCMAHKCPYISKINWHIGKQGAQHNGSMVQYTCNYILIQQRSRDCMPDVCEYWKDKKVKRLKADNQHLFSNENRN